MKKIFLGLILGALLMTTVSTEAAIEQYICYKSDYKVLINGVEYTNTDLPILNYKGNTYAPFKSILESAGLDVNWNAELNQAEVKNNLSTTNLLNESEVSNMAETMPFKKLTPDGITSFYNEDDGKYYVSRTLVYHKYKNKGYSIRKYDSNQPWRIYKNDYDIVIDNVNVIDNRFEYNYYVSDIMPILMN